MQSREMKERQIVRAKKVVEKLIPENDVREELQCVFCNCYTYLSYIGCECTSKVGCLEHVTEVSIVNLGKKKKKRTQFNIYFVVMHL